jgi:sugar phosphate isomerase/epimerase
LRFGYCGLIVDFSAPISSIEDEIVRAKALIDATQYLGIKSIRVPGNGIVAGQTLESTFIAVRDKFQWICEYADQADVTVYLHNHNHGATPSNGQQVVRMLDDLSDTSVEYVLDTGQFQGSPGASGEGLSDEKAAPALYESIEMCASRATMLRAKFYFAGPGDEQWLDYARIVGSLKYAEYSGAVSIVYERRGSVPSTEALPRAVRYLTQLFDK